MSVEPRILPSFTGTNLRPFQDIPEVGYSDRHSSWMMDLSQVKDGFTEILADIQAFTHSRHGTPDALLPGLSEHHVYQLLAAGIRIGIARERLRAGYDESGPVNPELLARLEQLGGKAELEYTGISWCARVRLKKPDGVLTGQCKRYGATQELAVLEMEKSAEEWCAFWNK